MVDTQERVKLRKHDDTFTSKIGMTHEEDVRTIYSPKIRTRKYKLKGKKKRE